MPDTDAVIETLRQASDGLLFPSETDAPFEPFFWPADSPVPLTSPDIVRLCGAPAGTPVKKVKLDTFFRDATTEEDWHNVAERAEVAQFQSLVKSLKAALKDIAVFHVGETKMDAYVVGVAEGGYAGLKTQVVET